MTYEEILQTIIRSIRIETGYGGEITEASDANSIDGWDSILSILQMPGGVPVATVALNGGKNAGILAAQIIGSSDTCVLDKVKLYKEGLKIKVEKASKNLKS